MTVIAGTVAGYLFAFLALAMMRMGAFHLNAAPGMPEHLTGLPLVLPMVHDLTGKGIAMVAAGWAVASFVGAYMAGLTARSTAAATLVQLGLTAGAVVRATQGMEPWWMAGGSVLLAWGGARFAETALCRASRSDRHAAVAVPQPAPAVVPVAANDRAAPFQPAPLPGFGRQPA